MNRSHFKIENSQSIKHGLKDRTEAHIPLFLMLLLLYTDLGLRRCPDGPDTVQSITGLHFLFLLHLTGANNPIPSANFKLTVCTETEEMWWKEEKRVEIKREVKDREGEKGVTRRYMREVRQKKREEKEHRIKRKRGKMRRGA